MTTQLKVQEIVEEAFITCEIKATEDTAEYIEDAVHFALIADTEAELSKMLYAFIYAKNDFTSMRTENISAVAEYVWYVMQASAIK